MVPQAAPSRATRTASGSLRSKFSTADSSLTSTSGCSRPQTPLPDQRSTSCLAVRAPSCCPILRSHLHISLSLLLSSLPRPHTSHLQSLSLSVSPAPEPPPLAPTVPGLFLPQPPRSPARSPQCPSLFHCLATFFSVSLVLCFPLPSCFKPQYRLQSLYTTPSLRTPSSPAPYLLASQAQEQSPVSSPSSAVPGLPGPKSNARQSGIRQTNRRSGCGPAPVSMVHRPSCQCGGGSSRASPSTAEQCPQTPAPAGGGISLVTIIHGDQSVGTAAGAPPILTSRRWRGGVS